MTKTPKKPANGGQRSVTPTDTLIGLRIRMRRNELNVSQAELGDALGVSFQQVQKYEKGVNRLGVNRLIHTAKALQCPVDYFYEGLTGKEKPRKNGDGAFAEFSASREGVELIKAMLAIPTVEIRQKILSLARTLAGQAEHAD